MQNYPNQGRDCLTKGSDVSAFSKLTKYSHKDTNTAVFPKLARQLNSEKLIMVGKSHFIPEFQQAVMNLVLSLKMQNPSRRVVLSSEFIALPEKELSSGQTLETYYTRLSPVRVEPLSITEYKRYSYAPATFYTMLENQVEVYPLEDMKQFELLNKSG